MSEKKLKLINMEEVETKEVDWLWYPYIPYGKITIVQGDPGEGKTTFILQLAARLTRGEKFPCDEAERTPSNVIYQNAEDGLEDTIKPRLLEAGADCSRILVIDEKLEPLTMSDERLDAAIRETGAKLVILDPIQAYLGARGYAPGKRDTACFEAAGWTGRGISLRLCPHRPHEQGQRHKIHLQGAGFN